MAAQEKDDLVRMVENSLTEAQKNISILFDRVRDCERNCSVCRESVMHEVNIQNNQMLARLHGIEMQVAAVTWKVSLIIGAFLLIIKFAPDFIAAVKALPI